MKVRIGWLNRPAFHLLLAAGVILSYPSWSATLPRSFTASSGAIARAILRLFSASGSTGHAGITCAPGCRACASSSAAARQALDAQLIRSGSMVPVGEDPQPEVIPE